MGEDGLRNPDLVREMEARGSAVSKTRLILHFCIASDQIRSDLQYIAQKTEFLSDSVSASAGSSDNLV